MQRSEAVTISTFEAAGKSITRSVMIKLLLRECQTVVSGPTLLWLHVQDLDEERPAVGGLLDDLGRRLARAVAGLGLDADQDGVVARLGRLERRGELEAVRGDDAVVVVGGGDQGRRDSTCRA